MEFIEESRGIYRPIRVLFDAPIYDRALQLCWNINSYNSQIALLRELLMLQEAYQIPRQVTPEDMIRFLMEESKSTLREQLWEFELEGFDEEDAKPLLMLVWAVNNSNKMRDIEFEAQMLLNSSEPIPPKFLHPKVLSMAMEYARILRTKQDSPSSQLLGPEEVVLEVVPRILQGLWTLPHRAHLNMPSQRLSKMSVGVTKAVLDRVTDALTGVESQTNFSRSIRDDVVQSILTKIRQAHPLDVLRNRIKSFAPVLLSEIADVAAEQIFWMFEPLSPKVPAVKPPATAPVQEDLTLTTTPSPETNPAVVSPLPTSQTLPVEPPSKTDVETREDDSEDDSKPSLENNPEPTRDPDSAAVPVSPAPPVEPPSTSDVETREDDRDKSGLENDQEPTRDPDSAVVPPTSTPPVEPPSITDVETRKDEHDEPRLEKHQELIRDPDSDAAPSAPAPPVEPPSKTDVETREDDSDKSGLGNDKEPTRDPDSSAVPPTSTPPAEPPSITDVEARKDKCDTSCSENNREATREPDSVAVLLSAYVPDVQAWEEENEKSSLEGKSTKEPDFAGSQSPLAELKPPAEPENFTAVQKRVQSVFSWLVQPVRCGFRVSEALSDVLCLTVNFMCKLFK